MGELSPLKRQRVVLDWFWNECGRQGNKHFVSKKNKDFTLDILKTIGEITVLWEHKPNVLAKKRMRFDKVKNKRHRFKSHKYCFSCRGKGEVRHHIVWLKYGGLNSKRNLVTLCKLCHSEIHPWLKAR
jgi:hypothetical protein